MSVRGGDVLADLVDAPVTRLLDPPMTRSCCWSLVTICILCLNCAYLIFRDLMT